MEENEHTHEHDESEELDLNDLLYEAHLKVDALIELLIRKKVIDEDEYNQIYEELLNEDVKEDENSDEEE